MIKAINKAFSFEEDLQEIAEAQESFTTFFEEKLRYAVLSVVPCTLAVGQNLGVCCLLCSWKTEWHNTAN